MSNEREQRYFKALGMRFEGQPGAIEAMLREQVQRVMAVADAEQAELWADCKALAEQVADTRRRAEAAEAKVARVKALVEQWIDEADQLALTDLPPFDHTLNLCAKSSPYDHADDLRAALDGGS